MRILVLHQSAGDEATVDEQDVLDQRDAVCQTLRVLGHEVSSLAATLDLAQLRQTLVEQRPDCVFNLVESLGGSDRLIALVPLLLESLDLPYTGVPASGLLETSNKVAAKRRLAQAGLPTLPWLEDHWLENTAALPFTWPSHWIRKPIHEHASFGMTDEAVVSCEDVADLALKTLQWQRCLGRPCFAEPFIEGREFNLSLLGPGDPRVLPIAEIEFVDFAPGKPRIVGYAAKWTESAAEYGNTRRRFEFPASDAPLLQRLSELATACWRLFNLSGYARVDFRVDAAGNPWILEINANPCLTPDSGFAAAIAEANIQYELAIARIVGYFPRSKIMNKLNLRDELTLTDRDAIRRIVTATGMFRPHEVDVAVELVDERLERGPASGYHFVLAEENGELVGYACYGHIAISVASYDLYWIVVDPQHQGRGVGRGLLGEIEGHIAALGGQQVFIETSGQLLYAPTRRFYERCGYALVATIPDYYAPGDSKWTFARSLKLPSG